MSVWIVEKQAAAAAPEHDTHWNGTRNALRLSIDVLNYIIEKLIIETCVFVLR